MRLLKAYHIMTLAVLSCLSVQAVMALPFFSKSFKRTDTDS